MSTRIISKLERDLIAKIQSFTKDFESEHNLDPDVTMEFFLQYDQLLETLFYIKREYAKYDKKEADRKTQYEWDLLVRRFQMVIMEHLARRRSN